VESVDIDAASNAGHVDDPDRDTHVSAIARGMVASNATIVDFRIVADVRCRAPDPSTASAVACDDGPHLGFLSLIVMSQLIWYCRFEVL
jgi:hypothetical protein